MIFLDEISSKRVYFEFGLLSLMSSVIYSLLISMFTHILYEKHRYFLYALTVVFTLFFSLVAWFFSTDIEVIIFTLTVGAFSLYATAFLRTLVDRYIFKNS